MSGDGSHGRGGRGRGSRGRVHDEHSAESDGGGSEDGTGRRARQDPDDPEQFARDTVYRLLTVRARSRSELLRALLRKGVEEETATAVLSRFDEAGLIDDAAFAESWVRERHEHQGLGRRALGAELRRKGVDEESVAEALARVDDDAEAERARVLVRRKLRGMTVTDATVRTRRLVGMLARKGYSQGLAFRVVREETESCGDDVEDVEDVGVDDSSP